MASVQYDGFGLCAGKYKHRNEVMTNVTYIQFETGFPEILVHELHFQT